MTTTPQQALSLLNNPFAFRMADRLATRAAVESGPGRAAQVRRTFRICFARDPSASELQDAQRFVARHGLAALARVLFNTNEFLYVD